MQDSEFQDLVDAVFFDLEDRIDELELDIDIDVSGGVLTFTLPNGSSIILSRQVASHEIWVAAKSGGFHLRYQDAAWYCETSEESFAALVDRVFTEQTGQEVALFK